MSRPQKDDTDDYIAALTGSSPKKNRANTIQDEEMHNAAVDTWTSNSYARLRDNRDKAQGHNCASVMVMGFSVLLFLIGVGLIVIGAIEKDQKLLPICPQCDKIVLGMYIAGGIVIAIALLGAAAANLRMKVLAVPYIVFLFLISIALLGVSAAVIVFSTGNGLGLKEAWIHDVVADSSEICSIQNDLQCSGFELGCCYGPDYNITTSTTAAPANTTSTASTTAPNTTTTEATTSTTTPTTTTTTETTTTTDTTTTVETTSTTAANTTTTGTTTTANTTSSTPAPPGGDYCYTLQNGNPPPWVAQVCVPGCASNSFAVTCDDAIRSKLKSNLGAIIGATIPLAFIMILTAILSWRMTKRVDVYE